MRRAFGLGLERRFNDPRHFGMTVNGFASSARRDLPYATDPLFTNPATPQSGSAALHLQFSSDLLIRLSSANAENDSRSDHHLLRC
jgi:hypothetical protein